MLPFFGLSLSSIVTIKTTIANHRMRIVGELGSLLFLCGLSFLSSSPAFASAKDTGGASIYHSGIAFTYKRIGKGRWAVAVVSKRSPKVEGIEGLLWPSTLVVNCTTEKGGGMTVTTKGQYVFNDFKQPGNEYVSGVSKEFCDYLIEAGAIKE